jgi:Domain of unknown function (DUF4062)/Caspase domain
MDSSESVQADGRWPTALISGTRDDMVEYRTAALDACLRARFSPIAMEHQSAKEQTAADLSMDYVDEAEVYIGILGARYGSIPKGGDRSYTEMEFDRATKNRIPRLIFLIDEKTRQVRLDDIEQMDDRARGRLRRLKERITQAGLLVDWFTSPEELKGQVYQALTEVRPSLDGQSESRSTGRPSGGGGATQRCRALLIGVGGYPSDKALHGPAIDVQLMKRALADGGAPHGDQWTIQECPEPSNQELRTQLMEFFDEARGCCLLVYYSGHGDAKGLYGRDSDLTRTVVTAGLLVELIRSSGAASVVLLLDCCNSVAPPSAEAGFGDLGADLHVAGEPDVAVVFASRGLADDGGSGRPSPFTESLVKVLSDPVAFDRDGLTVDGLLVALERMGEKPWTNQGYAGAAVVAARPGALMPVGTSPPALSLDVEAGSILADRLPLLLQLVRTIDCLLAVAPNVDAIPLKVVSDGIDVLAAELRDCSLTSEQQSALSGLLGDAELAAEGCGMLFDAGETHVPELPWEYVALCQDQDRKRQIAMSRTFRSGRKKDAPPRGECRVALFSSLKVASIEDAELLTEMTLEKLPSAESTSQAGSAQWSQVSSAQDNSDVVVLQAPVARHLDQDGAYGVGLMFVGPGEGRPWFVGAQTLIATLSQRYAMRYLLIESVADSPTGESALILRTLAEKLARSLDCAVMAVCHARAYLDVATQSRPAFCAEVIHRHSERGVSLARAAAEARDEVLRLFGGVGAIVGVPIVMQPWAVDEEPHPPDGGERRGHAPLRPAGPSRAQAEPTGPSVGTTQFDPTPPERRRLSGEVATKPQPEVPDDAPPQPDEYL